MLFKYCIIIFLKIIKNKIIVFILNLSKGKNFIKNENIIIQNIQRVKTN